MIRCWLDVSPWSYNKRKVSGYFLNLYKLFEHLKMVNKQTKNQQKKLKKQKN